MVQADGFHPGSGRDHRYFLALLAANLVIGRIAAHWYADTFLLFHTPVSDLGATATQTGVPNPTSPWIFSVGLVVSAAIMYRFSCDLLERGFPPSAAPVRLARLASLGFVIMPAPHNLPVFHTIHMSGAAAVVFSLWLFGMRYLAQCRRGGLIWVFRVGMVVLQAGVLTYAALFVVSSPARQAAQAWALLAISTTLTCATGVLAARRRRALRASEIEPVA